MNISVDTTSLKIIEGLLIKLKNPNLIDNVLRKNAIDSTNRLIKNTPKDTNRTSRRWKPPKKTGNLEYTTTNDMTSQDGKHSIIKILEDGRGIVRPKRAKKLFIPISRRAKYKKLGAPIPDNYEYGKDYIFAKQARATKPLKYLEKETKITAEQITKDVQTEISKVLSWV